jgi:hypothetical protein
MGRRGQTQHADHSSSGCSLDEFGQLADLAAQPKLGLLPERWSRPGCLGPSRVVASRKNLKSLAQGPQSIEKNKEGLMFIVLFAVLLLAWLGGFLVFHISSALIHILLLFAVLSLIVHLFQRKTVS